MDEVKKPAAAKPAAKAPARKAAAKADDDVIEAPAKPKAAARARVV